MTFILKYFDIKPYIRKFTRSKFANIVFGFIKTNRVLVKISCFLLVGLCALIISFVSVGVTVGFKVNYSGKVIATVSDASVFDSAKDIAVKNISGANADKALKKPVFIMTLTVADKLSSVDTLADAIIENTNDISQGKALVVNGEIKICTQGEGLSDMLEARLTQYYVDGAENTSSFTDNVELVDGYYLNEDLKDIFDAQAIIDDLDVKTVSTTVTENTVTYSVKKIKTSSYETGYHKIYKEGKNGVTRTTVVSETVNGTQSCENKVSSETISEPSEQVEIIGTAAPKVSATERAEASSEGFIFPLNRGTYQITSYYGDGRNHKGIDLGADTGTAIFAVSDGTVTYAGYDSDYGYNVVVDHGNGIKTRYAHASALCVSKGDKVSQGDMIAAVGNTGWSTGSHLHFEVIVNGVRVNPAPYIGL